MTAPKSGLVLNIILRKAENREEWMKLVVLQWCPNGQPDYGIDKKRYDYFNDLKSVRLTQLSYVV